MEATTLHLHPKEPPNPNGKKSYAMVTSDQTSEIMKIYAKFVEEARKERNILEIKFTRMPNSISEGSRKQYVDIETIGEYLFDEKGLKP